MLEYGFPLTPVYSLIRTESTILSLDGRIRVSENPYSRIFYAVSNILGDPDTASPKIA